MTPVATAAPVQVESLPKKEDLNKKRTKCEVWTRVMGYHRPVQNFNIGKKSEHYSRNHFCENKTSSSCFCESV
ncbi:ribonucleoside-triphosphate reductase [Candidatus Peregrinibacteria bacterium]|nr:MAG: ribonucleoside-triphosphate reductase [Candidatus Peregrinibacteria bacterium]